MTASQALARKWRPRSFSELVGQEHVVRALRNALESGRLHHAYLFTGTRGVGKTTIARILAKCLNCETGLTAEPCGTCATCRDIDSGRFPDMLEVDAATNTKVEEMRELLDNAQYMPVSGRYKVYIIDEVHMLSRSAFNSMLKTLEEPPEHVKFILATTDPQKVPVTVLSRCLQFNLRPMPQELIASRLAHILEQEKVPFEVPALSLLAQAAQGSMRDSLSLLDQAVAFGGGQVRTAEVGDMLGTIERQALLDVLQSLVRKDGPGLMRLVQDMAERGISFERALQELALMLHELALMRAIPDSEFAAAEPALAELAPHWDDATLQLLYQIAIQSRRDLSLAPDESAGFRMALLRMLAFQPGAAAPAAEQVSGERSTTRSPAPKAAEKAVAPRQERPSPPQTPAAVPPQTPVTVASKDPPPAIDDWSGLAQRLAGAGMAHELARHSEMVRYADGTLHLLLDAEHRHLLPYKEKLRTALEAILDADIRLSVETGEASGQSLAAVEYKQQAVRQREAEASIKNDPFVRAVTESLGGKLVESTIKPDGQDQGEAR
ncbi:MAG: DNA polymerase III subunit gamma/tau [Betaproteobacteria bacterium]|nr:DNA polymerase III subunit gamma/tau [Betaproteobacteria bacterium]MDE2353856.1 DNA polymerase III subunit gamma/tau [Betaproteobacteria bacterium]